MPKSIVFLNQTAGTLKSLPDPQRTIGELLARSGIDPSLKYVPPAELRTECKRALDSDVRSIIVGGGDGTLSTAAGVLAGSETPLGILPLGTLNHFAKDLGIPTQLEEAIAVIARGQISSVDLGEVNGRTFINNSSLGIYPRLVIRRELHQRLHGMRKWTAMLLAAASVIRRFPTLSVTVTLDEQIRTAKTPLVFIGNNTYQLNGLTLGTRERVDAGELSLCLAHATSRWQILKLILSAILGTLDQARDFESFSVRECRIDSRRRHLSLALDGEVTPFQFPLEYKIRPAALRVFTPPPASSGQG